MLRNSGASWIHQLPAIIAILHITSQGAFFSDASVLTVVTGQTCPFEVNPLGYFVSSASFCKTGTETEKSFFLYQYKKHSKFPKVATKKISCNLSTTVCSYLMAQFLFPEWSTIDHFID